VTASWFADALQASGFLRRHPHFTAIVAAMEPMATDQVPIMATARHWRRDGKCVLRLYVNPEWLATEPEHFAGVLQHEIHHVLCGHLDDKALHAVAEPRWMELAMELAANENIQEALPPGFHWQSFAEFGITANQSTRTRYDLLVQAAQSGRLRMVDDAALDLLLPAWRKQGKRRPGSIRVVVMPKRRGILPWSNRPRLVDGDLVDDHRPGGRARQGGRGLGDALDRANDGAHAGTWQQNGWISSPTSDDQLAAWRQRILQHLRGEIGGAVGAPTASSRTSKELPRAIARDRGGALAWPAILAAFLRLSRTVHPTWLRPSRRFPERLGELPGRHRRRPRPRLLVGLDTSASMDADAMATALGEIRRLARYAEPTIVEVDAAVHRVHRDLHVEVVTGGGDTDFEPLFGLGHQSGFDGIVYFTDGIGPVPDAPPSLPVLWVLLGDAAFESPWGSVVRLQLPGR
jgi:predicted metal-dependent peptidase